MPFHRRCQYVLDLLHWLQRVWNTVYACVLEKAHAIRELCLDGLPQRAAMQACSKEGELSHSTRGLLRSEIKLSVNSLINTAPGHQSDRRGDGPELNTMGRCKGCAKMLRSTWHASASDPVKHSPRLICDGGFSPRIPGSAPYDVNISRV